MYNNIKKPKIMIAQQVSAKQYFQERLPFVKSYLPTETSFICVLQKRKLNPIKLKELSVIK